MKVVARFNLHIQKKNGGQQGALTLNVGETQPVRLRFAQIEIAGALMVKNRRLLDPDSSQQL